MLAHFRKGDLTKHNEYDTYVWDDGEGIWVTAPDDGEDDE